MCKIVGVNCVRIIAIVIFMFTFSEHQILLSGLGLRGPAVVVFVYVTG